MEIEFSGDEKEVNHVEVTERVPNQEQVVAVPFESYVWIEEESETVFKKFHVNGNRKILSWTVEVDDGGDCFIDLRDSLN
ncbi:hypothetical protein LXL04_001610 [Taraxacum kok-saghyz]